MRIYNNAVGDKPISRRVAVTATFLLPFGIVLMLLDAPVSAAEFSATMRMTLVSKTGVPLVQNKSHVFVKGTDERMELPAPTNQILISLHSKGLVLSLWPKTRTYTEQKTLRMEPKRPSRNGGKLKQSTRQIGHDVYLGYPCEITETTWGSNGESSKIWFSKRLNHTLKSISVDREGNTNTMELIDIREQSVSAKLFKVPGNYRKAAK